MCGIVGYVGQREMIPMLISGLKKLEYRGYDSAGIALLNHGITVIKSQGKIKVLEEKTSDVENTASVGIGHTRWATHGEPNDQNAHPHNSMNGHFSIVHNGIIENYNTLKRRLTDRGYTFRSDTDTEVLVNLIEYIYLKGKTDALTAVRFALKKVVGAYGIAVICADEPDKIIAARNSSPLVIGIGNGENFLASDATPIIEYTRKVIYLDDMQLAVVTADEVITIGLQDNGIVSPEIQTLDLDLEAIEKGNFPHFMLKEIFEQPASIKDTFRGRLSAGTGEIHLGGIHTILPRLQKADRIILVGCGTSWHAALVGGYLFEEFAGIPASVEYGSEFRYRKTILHKDDVVIAISQSGETADTLAAVKKAQESGATVLGICNVVGSSIARLTQAGVYTHAGPEIGVASTKAFTAQITILTMMAMMLGRQRGVLDQKFYLNFIRSLQQIPGHIGKILSLNENISELAANFFRANNFIYLGRGYSFPVALEGALKLKEISYIHAEGYPAAEMKHGPIALIDENMPVVVIAPRDDSYEKIVSNVQEIIARGGKVIAVVNEGDRVISALANAVLEIPETNLALTPLLSVIPLQLLAYHVAVLRGCDVDQPRNLAKSVTVE